MKLTIQIVILILISIALFWLDEMKGRWDIARHVNKIEKEDEEIIYSRADYIETLQKELTDFANNQREFYKKTHNGY